MTQPCIRISSLANPSEWEEHYDSSTMFEVTEQLVSYLSDEFVEALKDRPKRVSDAELFAGFAAIYNGAARGCDFSFEFDGELFEVTGFGNEYRFANLPALLADWLGRELRLNLSPYPISRWLEELTTSLQNFGEPNAPWAMRVEESDEYDSQFVPSDVSEQVFRAERGRQGFSPYHVNGKYLQVLCGQGRVTFWQE